MNVLARHLGGGLEEAEDWPLRYVRKSTHIRGTRKRKTRARQIRRHPHTPQ